MSASFNNRLLNGICERFRGATALSITAAGDSGNDQLSGSESLSGKFGSPFNGVMNFDANQSVSLTINATATGVDTLIIEGNYSGLSGDNGLLIEYTISPAIQFPLGGTLIITDVEFEVS